MKPFRSVAAWGTGGYKATLKEVFVTFGFCLIHLWFLTCSPFAPPHNTFITWWLLFLGILELLVQNSRQKGDPDLILSQWPYHQSFGVGNKTMISGKIMENNGAHFHLFNQEAIKYSLSNIRTMSKEACSQQCRIC